MPLKEIEAAKISDGYVFIAYAKQNAKLRCE